VTGRGGLNSCPNRAEWVGSAGFMKGLSPSHPAQGGTLAAKSFWSNCPGCVCLFLGSSLGLLGWSGWNRAAFVLNLRSECVGSRGLMKGFVCGCCGCWDLLRDSLGLCLCCSCCLGRASSSPCLASSGLNAAELSPLAPLGT